MLRLLILIVMTSLSLRDRPQILLLILNECLSESINFYSPDIILFSDISGEIDVN